MSRVLASILRGGYCTRWHANPDLAHIRETLAEHHARVAQILLALHPRPALRLIDAALHHDAGEPAVGDLPHPFKRACPQIAAAHADAEDKARLALGIDIGLTDEEAAWLALADRLAAWAHVAQVAPQLLAHPDWTAARAHLVGAGWSLGCAPEVEAILRAMEGRA